MIAAAGEIYARRIPIARDGAKLPEATAGFWLVNVAASALGATAGVSPGSGQLAATALLAAALTTLVAVQSLARRFRPALYWMTVVASAAAGRTLADLAGRSTGIGRPGELLLLAACAWLSLAIWRVTLGTASIRSVRTPAVVLFYWLAVIFSQTLGMALDGRVAGGTLDHGGAPLFGTLLLALVALYALTSTSRAVLFWTALVLTQPLGVALRDLLVKPLALAGLELARPLAYAIPAGFVAACATILPQPSASGDAP